MIRSCCGCCSLRIGCFLIGSYLIISSTIFTLQCMQSKPDILLALTYFTRCIAAIALIYGAIKEQTLPLKVFIFILVYYSILFYIILVITWLLFAFDVMDRPDGQKVTRNTTVIVIVLIVYLVLFTYFLLVAFFYFKELKNRATATAT
ncbi:uncharacterized protein LOC115633927 [Scaptodrosophila lebanonensis]|uniref:Uncharacterized protein LOC115633927 n=1 Tax=Drosophila lebanonensis TaxID=7225 RepID=A0A6J2UIH8_DROLE|nr:uncharacterized protein LOC115633927 [Scaptodrosophila lebanonensis]